MYKMVLVFLLVCVLVACDGGPTSPSSVMEHQSSTPQMTGGGSSSAPMGVSSGRRSGGGRSTASVRPAPAVRQSDMGLTAIPVPNGGEVWLRWRLDATVKHFVVKAGSEPNSSDLLWRQVGATQREHLWQAPSSMSPEVFVRLLAVYPDGKSLVLVDKIKLSVAVVGP